MNKLNGKLWDDDIIKSFFCIFILTVQAMFHKKLWKYSNAITLSFFPPPPPPPPRFPPILWNSWKPGLDFSFKHWIGRDMCTCFIHVNVLRDHDSDVLFFRNHKCVFVSFRILFAAGFFGQNYGHCIWLHFIPISFLKTENNAHNSKLGEIMRLCFMIAVATGMPQYKYM